MPTELTIAELIDLLRDCAGEDETVNMEGDVFDVTFTDLGYDSLAVLQTTGRIEREFGLTFDEEAVSAAETPRQFLALVNEALLGNAAA